MDGCLTRNAVGESQSRFERARCSILAVISMQRSPCICTSMHLVHRNPSIPNHNSCADLFEGSVIRATRRLDELMQQLTRAARVVGDEGLAAKIEESNMTIRRDIIFAASLYV